jgi:PAS domain S-box-containing protein
MRVFALVSLLASVMAASLGAYVLRRDSSATLNRVFFLYCMTGAAWCFAEFGYRQAESYVAASFWLQVGAAAIFTLPLELDFALRFAGRTRLFKRRLIYILLYIPALFFAITELSGTISSQPVQAFWGWTYVAPEHGLQAVFEIWVVVLWVASLAVTFGYYSRTTDSAKKRQALLVSIGLVIPTILGVLTEPSGVLDVLGVQIPELTSVGFAIESVLVMYAIVSVELFPMASASVAESIVSTIADALFLVDTEGTIVAVNRSALQITGYAEGEMVGLPVDKALEYERDSRPQLIGSEQALSVNPIRDVEAILVTKDGSEIPVSVSASGVQDRTGAQEAVVYVARDVTERKRVEEQIKASLQEKEILLQEIHHRVKNNLQIVSSLLSLQRESVGDRPASEVLVDSQSRVQAMAVIHETLYQAQDFAKVNLAEYVEGLAGHMLRTYGGESKAIRLTTNVVDAELSVDVAMYCGLIIHELVSNAFRHAFPDERAGEIVIDLSLAGDGQMVLCVRDDGIGLSPEVIPGQTSSLGLELVTVLTKQLGGVLHIDRGAGTQYKIVFPH